MFLRECNILYRLHNFPVGLPHSSSSAEYFNWATLFCIILWNATFCTLCRLCGHLNVAVCLLCRVSLLECHTLHFLQNVWPFECHILPPLQNVSIRWTLLTQNLIIQLYLLTARRSSFRVNWFTSDIRK